VSANQPRHLKEYDVAEQHALYVARETDVDALSSLWKKSTAGDAQTLRLQAPFGGGRRALVTEFCKRAKRDDDMLIWQVNCLPEENGIQWLIRMYGSLLATVTSDVLQRGKIELILNSQLPSQPKRVQGWYQQFIETMKNSKADAATGKIQVSMPQDNPLIGLVEITTAIARRTPIMLSIQTPYAVNSLLPAMFLEALHQESRQAGTQLMVILSDEPEDEARSATHPMPLLDLYTRNADSIHTHAITPWGDDETTAYLTSKQLGTANASQFATMASGRPGFIAELIDILNGDGKLEADLADATMASLVPMDVDASELSDDDSTEEGRRRATKDDAAEVAHIAALLGHAFPSGIVADVGGLDRGSVDDLLDAMSDLFEEVQFSEEMGTWIYRFKNGSWREGVIAGHRDEEGTQRTQKLAMFMERFLVPRGYAFLPKATRLYADAGSPQRANIMRALHLTRDAGDSWGLAFDLSRYFDEVSWPITMQRTIYQHLLEHLSERGRVAEADTLHQEATTWASEQEDRDFTAWLLYSGSKINLRKQELPQAAELALDAVKMYEALDQAPRTAEIYNHLATIYLHQGERQKASEHVDKALDAAKFETPDGKEGVPPQIFAMSSHLRGLIARRSNDPNQLETAASMFRQANDVAGQAGLGGMALDSGWAYGECLLAMRKVEDAKQVLEQVLKISVSLKNAMRERATTELLAQCLGALGEHERALVLAQRTLQLTQQLKMENRLPLDLYNLGFFLFLNKKPAEALGVLGQANERIGGVPEGHPMRRDLAYYMGLAQLQTGDAHSAVASLRGALALVDTTQEPTRTVAVKDALGTALAQSGDKVGAKNHLEEALAGAKASKLDDQAKAIEGKLAQLK
jgi:tetratricopeptide (TPR) repeat protein